MTEKTYTRAEVSAAVNAAADLIAEELSTNPQALAALDLVVHATAKLLDNPNTAFADVAGEYPAADVEEVKGWLH